MDRNEYVMNDKGYIWVGSARYNRGLPWLFGQVIKIHKKLFYEFGLLIWTIFLPVCFSPSACKFEDISLDCALWLLDEAGLSAAARSSPIPVVRTMSAMVSVLWVMTLGDEEESNFIPSQGR